ncbi:MAG: two pore domain potassium channel family protein [Desulfobulbaceae bacterium]|nr:two pore domain potassium channel family protein [Desulfobulbaceae bacterium]
MEHCLIHTSDCLTNPDHLTLRPAGGVAHSIYFSFVTMATVGYGDIVPIGIGKFIACVQIVASMLFGVIAISCFASLIVALHTGLVPQAEIEDTKRKFWASHPTADEKQPGESEEGKRDSLPGV